MGILIHWKQHVYVLWCMAYVFKWGTCEKSNINHCTRRFILAQVKHQNLIPRSWEKTVPTDLDNNFNINATFWSFWIKTYKKLDLPITSFYAELVYDIIALVQQEMYKIEKFWVHKKSA